MKILFLERSLGLGGAQRQLVALVIGLKQRGHDVKVALFYPEGEFISELQAAGVPVHVLKKTSRWDIAKFTYLLRRFVRQERPDVLCTFLEVPNLFATLLKMTTRIRIVWGIRSSTMDMRVYDALTAFSYKACAWLSFVPDKIVANSISGKEHAVARGFRRSNLLVIQNGIDTDRFQLDEAVRSSLRKAWKVEEDAVLVGLIGRLDPIKGHPEFIKAASYLADKNQRLRFVCVGESGPLSIEDVEMMALRHGLDETRFAVVGKRTDMPAVMSALDIACSPSLSEGFSNSIAEAMARGIPCVATDVGDARVMIGDTGIVVPQGDVISLAESILRLANDQSLRLRLGEAARRRILPYSLPQMTDRFEQVFSALLPAR